jgi:hypothetical protein
MARPFHMLLAESLTRVEKSAKDGIVHGTRISRHDRERLQKGGWLQPIITGWYLLHSPQAREGESTAWMASFWGFLQQYLQERFGEDYCLSAESSLDIHTASNVIPKQVIVITKQGGNCVLPLPHKTSLLIYQDLKNFPTEVEIKNKLQVMSLGLALCKVAKTFFQNQAMNAQIALTMVRDSSELTRPLLQSGMVAAAGRLIGAYQWLDMKVFAEEIQQTMQIAKFDVRADNPFELPQPYRLKNQRSVSPYYYRIQCMWEQMRTEVVQHFPKRQPTQASEETIFQRINDNYVNDAYHSLSIEGYNVSEQLIAKIQKGEWNPDYDSTDNQHRDALAAKGYYEAFLLVKKSIKHNLAGKDAAEVIQKDLASWYQALFSPSVDAGILEIKDLAGYRNERVYIRNSLHVPPAPNAVLDCMDAFFHCLHREKNPIVRAVLGHFIFVFIHPYMDGNGRIGRFLMNMLWIAAGYPWTVVRVESRAAYLRALEQASVEKDIKPFTAFLATEMKASEHNEK